MMKNVSAESVGTLAGLAAILLKRKILKQIQAIEGHLGRNI